MSFRNRLHKIKLFVVNHKWSLLLGVLAFLVAGFFLWDSFGASNFNLPDFGVGRDKEELVRAPLSGIMVKEEVAKRKPIGVMIENHPDARPQSGLNEADIVFEAVAEGGITRFLAIFHSRDASEIGPVRSARPYYVRWASGLKALYAHVGGSKEGLSLIKSLDVYDLDQFSLGSFFRRDPRRFAPHNVYTSTENLRKAAKSKGFPLTDENVPALSFKDDAPEGERPDGYSFTVNFNFNYAPTYTYNQSCNCFLRSIRGVKQTDLGSGKQISAKNVVVAFASVSTEIIRGTGYTSINTNGTGSAYYYIDGKKVAGKWVKNGDKSPISFYDKDGKPISFNAGTTWVDFVPRGTSVR